MFNKKTFFVLSGIMIILLTIINVCSKETIVQTTGNMKKYTIVVDAGHGAPDERIILLTSIE